MADRLFVSTVQAFCRAARVAVTFKRHGDLYTVTDSAFRCRYLSDQSASLDPRLVLPLEGGLAYLTRDDLQELGDGGVFRLQELERDGTLSLGMQMRGWEAFATDIAARMGAEAVAEHHTGTLADLLLALGTCSEAEIGKATTFKGPDETLGAALVRLDLASLEAVLEALIGSSFLYRQPPPGGEVVLPQADRAGELLFRQGLVSRSDLLHYELLAGKQGRDFLELLTEEGRVTADQARAARRREEFKRLARAGSRVPLGEVVVMRGQLSQETLDEVLAQQAAMPEPPPLGHLLVDRGLLSPESLAEVLRAQDERLEALVDRELKAEEPPPRAGFRRSAPAAGKSARRRKVPPSGIALGIMGVVLVGALGYVAYSLGPGRGERAAQATPTPDPLAFLTHAAAGRRDGEGLMTISDVKRSAGPRVERDLDDLENPEYVDETADLETYVELQQAELQRFQKSAQNASKLASGFAGKNAMAAAERAMAGGGAGRAAAGGDAGRVAAGGDAGRAEAGGGAGRAAAGGDAGRTEAGERTDQATSGQARARDGGRAGERAGDRGPGAGKPASDRNAGSRPGTLAPPPAPGPAAAEVAANTQALLDVANGSYADARKTLAEAVRQHPHNPVTLFNLGLCDYHLGQHAQAIESFGKARILLEAGSGNLMRLAGPELLARLQPDFAASASVESPPPGRPMDALRALVRVWALEADCITYQGHVLTAMGRKEDARGYFREALPYIRKKAIAQTALGDVQRRSGDMRAAIGSFAAAARLDPRYPAPWLALHEVAREQGQEALARRYRGIYDRLVSRKPTGG